MRNSRGQKGGCCQIATSQKGSRAALIDFATTPIPPYLVPIPDVTKAIFCRNDLSRAGDVM
jgi:hypothetical protein